MKHLLLLFIPFLLFSCQKEILNLEPSPKQNKSFNIQGFNIGVWSKTGIRFNDISILLDSIKKVGSNTVSIDIGVNVDDNGFVIPIESQMSQHPKISDLVTIFDLCKSKGFENIIFKPHTIDNNTSNRLNWNVPDTLKYNSNILKEWGNYLVNVTKLLGKNTPNIICIGTEMNTIDSKKKDEWVSLIKNLRSVYNGKLTYDALFDRWTSNPDIAEVTFWDELDYIGLSLYAPVTKNNNPTENEINNGWITNPYNLGNPGEYVDNIITYLSKISSSHGNKKIIALESGYQSCDNSLWDVVSYNEKTNYDLQTKGIKILLKNIKENPSLFEGLTIWGLNDYTLEHMRNNNKQAYVNEFPTLGKPSNLEIQKYYLGN
jgi:hypothetical protein